MSSQPAADFFLTIQTGPHAGQNHSLNKNTITLGRQSNNQIVVDDPMVSRHHLRFVWQGNAFLLEDLGSANGTWINEVHVTTPMLLRSGDIIRLGQHVQFAYGHQGKVSAAAPPAKNDNWLLVGLGGTIGIMAMVILILGGAVGYYLWQGGQSQQPPTTAASLPENTPVPLQTATSQPVDTATSEPIATATPKPTETPTVIPTPTSPPATPTPPPDTPTPVSTPTPQPVISQAPIKSGLNKIAFVSNRDGNQEIYVMNADGSGVQRLTNNPAEDNSPVWSPDGGTIAFVSTRDGNSEIYLMAADGRGQTNLSENPTNDYDPSWAGNGAKLVFTSSRDDPIRSDLWVMNSDGSNQTKLQNFGTSPAWSPDNSRIAGIFRFGGLTHLGVMPADGSTDPQPLLQTGINNSPAWSPNNQRIAFENAESADNSEIMVINADGRNLVNLTNNRDIIDLYPTWSPDGVHIAFVSNRDGNDEIYVINADGSGVQRLTNHPAWDAQPNWYR